TPLTSVRVGDGIASARLRLPGEEAATTRSAFSLHPSVLDGAVQVVAALPEFATPTPERPLVPIALEWLDVYATLPDEVVVRVRAGRMSHRAGRHLRVFDIDLLDTSGDLLVELKDMTIAAPGDAPE